MGREGRGRCISAASDFWAESAGVTQLCGGSGAGAGTGAGAGGCSQVFGTNTCVLRVLAGFFFSDAIRP